MADATPSVTENVAQSQAVDIVAEPAAAKTLTIEEVEQFLSTVENKEEYLAQIAEKFKVKFYDRFQKYAKENKTFREQIVPELETKVKQYEALNPDATKKEIEDYKAKIALYENAFKEAAPYLQVLQVDSDMQALLKEKMQVQGQIAKIGIPETPKEDAKVDELAKKLAEIEKKEQDKIAEAERMSIAEQNNKIYESYKATMDNAFKEMKIPQELWATIYDSVTDKASSGLVKDLDDVPTFVAAEWDKINSFTQKQLKAKEEETLKRFNTAKPADAKPSSASTKPVAASPSSKPIWEMTQEERIKYFIGG